MRAMREGGVRYLWQATSLGAGGWTEEARSQRFKKRTSGDLVGGSLGHPKWGIS